MIASSVYACVTGWVSDCRAGSLDARSAHVDWWLIPSVTTRWDAVGMVIESIGMMPSGMFSTRPHNQLLLLRGRKPHH